MRRAPRGETSSVLPILSHPTYACLLVTSSRRLQGVSANNFEYISLSLLLTGKYFILSCVGCSRIANHNNLFDSWMISKWCYANSTEHYFHLSHFDDALWGDELAPRRKGMICCTSKKGDTIACHYGLVMNSSFNSLTQIAAGNDFKWR